MLKSTSQQYSLIIFSLRYDKVGGSSETSH